MMGGQILFSGFFLVLIVFFSFNLQTGGLGWITKFNALLIVLGGTFFVSLIIYPWGKIAGMFLFIGQTIKSKEKIQQTIQIIVGLARSYRKEWSMRSLEQQAQALPAGLLRKGVELIILRYGRDEIEQVLRREGSYLNGQIEASRKILQTMAQLAPSLGLIATIVNLIRVFTTSGEIPQILPYMAAALLSTFYGLSFANLCLLPLASKLKDFKGEESARTEIIIQGVMNLYEQEHPRTVQSKLEEYALLLNELAEIPPEPEFSLLSAHEVAMESKRAGSVLLN
jgi:chemotaxis protein MotA